MHSTITAVQNSHKYSFKKQELQFCYTVYFPPAILIVLCIHLNISIGFMFYCLYCSNYVGYVTVRFLLGTINYYCTNLDFLQGSFICTFKRTFCYFFHFLEQFVNECSCIEKERTVVLCGRHFKSGFALPFKTKKSTFAFQNRKKKLF
jgi:hypothetical protein